MSNWGTACGPSEGSSKRFPFSFYGDLSRMNQMSISRRCFLEQSGLAVTASLLADLSSAQQGGTKPSRKRIFSGALWWLASDLSGDIRDRVVREIEDQNKAGFDLLWVCSTHHVLDMVRKKGLEDPFPILFREAERLGMRVLIETFRTSKWWVDTDWEKEKRENDKFIRDFLEKYGDRKSFWGWYIGYENHHAEGETAKNYTSLLKHIRALCRRESPEKPVMISPFFLLDRKGLLGFKWIEPEEFERFWGELLKETEIDILALQDSGEHLSCYTIEERRPFLKAGKKACDNAGSRFWGNVETAEIQVESVEEYARTKNPDDPGGNKHPNWRLVPLHKLKNKVALAEEFSEELVTWGYTEFWRPSRGEKARKYYEEYLRWVESQG